MIFIQLFPYLLLLLAFIVIPRVLPNNYLGVLFIIISLFAGLRYGVGWDYFNYTESIREGGWRIENNEWIPRQLMFLCNKFNAPQLFFLVTSVCFAFFYFIAIKKLSDDIKMSLFALIVVPVFFINSLTTVRYSIAVGIMFCAACYYKDNWIVSLLLAICAWFTHRAAIVGLLAIPLLFNKCQVSKTTNIIFFLGCLIFSFLGSFGPTLESFFNLLGSFSDGLGELSEYGQNYVSGASTVGLSRTPYMYAIMNLGNFVFYDKLVSGEHGERVSKYITLFNLGCSIMFLMSFSQTFASRLSQPFLAFILLLAPHYKKTKTLKFIFIAMFIFAYFFQLSIPGHHFAFVGRQNCYLPYRTFI